MKTLFILFLCILLIGIWFTIDFHLGRKKHLSLVKSISFPKRKSTITLYTAGEELFDKMFDDIRNACHHIHIEFYIVKNDKISKRFISLLKKKATEGVEVRLLLDWMGSLSFKGKTIKELRNSGVKFAYSHAPKFPFFFYSSQERNHRKITIIDGHIGYLGGFNIGKEYIGADPKLSPWRDYHLRIKGEGVQDLEMVYLTDWQEATGATLNTKQIYIQRDGTGVHSHQIIPTEGAFLEEQFISLIQKATTSIIIGTPYFIPSNRIMNELLKVLKAGITLSIIVPYESDHLLVKEASYTYFRKLLEVGATVYQYQKGFFHAKYILIDEQILDIGTANFDKRSLFLNHEVNCFIYDKNCIQNFKKAIDQDIQNSTILSFRDLSNVSTWIKLKEKMAHLLSSFL
ncbi:MULTISPECIES: cardiolipin synthase [Bacillus]|uniref:cardiolipin synthase n=1 Tax=Bacillus TaxID=1386 RepID=UPI00037A0313|nr:MULTISPECIES: cardiolipin synthase [Bacillus]